jgi:flagellar biosynthesis/type III secretory pathway protein FliH
MDYSLAINPKDAEILIPALKGDDLFKEIKVNEDPALPPGGFKISSRDLEVEDFPQLLGAGDEE